MKALVYEGPRTMNVREVNVPAPGEDEVLIRVVRAGICGSELSGYLGHNSLRKPPLVMGHEFSGVIEQVGSRMDGFRAGDRVTVNPLVSCGHCRACITGNAQLCAERKLLGAHLPGAFAEYVTAAGKNVHRLPDSLGFDDAAMTEPYAVALHICRKLAITPVDRLVIVGAGPIGLLTLLVAREFGAKDIVVTDLNAERLEIVRDLGGIGQSTPPDAGAFDAAVDAVGLTVTRNQCIAALVPGGRIMFSGLHEADSSLPINTVIRSEISMYGAFAYNHDDFKIALDWLASKREGTPGSAPGGKRADLLPWTIHAPLEEGAACFDKLIGNPGKVAKILFDLA
jgi:2-desacetyl-2-hydroxyethyl bacteriochlorophyllide A dehydrogenase